MVRLPRALTVMSVLAVAVAFGVAGPAEAQQVDRDCADFAFQEDAQEFFIAEGGPTEDPHNLDRDNDGIACETLPSRGAQQPTITPEPADVPGPIRTPRSPRTPQQLQAPFQDRDCADFPSQAAAQAFFEAEGGPAHDPHQLDADNDGIACEETFRTAGQIRPTRDRAAPPGRLPVTGAEVSLIGLIGWMLTGAGSALILMARRHN